MTEVDEVTPVVQNGGDAPSLANGVNGTSHQNGHPSSYSAKYNLAPHFIGGNNLGAASPSKVRNFVQAYDGHTVIRNVGLP